MYKLINWCKKKCQALARSTVVVLKLLASGKLIDLAVEKTEEILKATLHLFTHHVHVVAKCLAPLALKALLVVALIIAVIAIYKATKEPKPSEHVTVKIVEAIFQTA
jgi:hypothetical protein